MRTAKGGSAKQIMVRVGKGNVDVRLLNSRECARLMGAPDFTLDSEISKNDYLFGFGDGVCSSAIEFLDQNYITPIYDANLKSQIYNLDTSKTYTMNLSPTTRKTIIESYKQWATR